MSSRRIAASASALARSSLAPKTPVAALVFARHASSRPSDEHTLAKSTDMLNALVGSTVGLDSTPTTTTAPSTTIDRRTATASPSPAGDVDMVVPPARDPLLDYIASVIQRHGRRARAAQIVSRMLLHVHTFTRAPPTPIVRAAVMTAAPAVRVVSYKYGTKVMMTPHPLTEKQRVRAGLVAIISASASRPGKSLDVRLAREMIAVVQGESKTLEDKERVHKLAMVNRGNIRR